MSFAKRPYLKQITSYRYALCFSILLILYLLQVNNHGDLTFDSPFFGYYPQVFPIIGGPRMIAPFWADIDTTGTGYVWYRATNDASLLSKAKQDIPYSLSGSNFSPLWLFIATWDHVGYYSNHVDKVCVTCITLCTAELINNEGFMRFSGTT